MIVQHPFERGTRVVRSSAIVSLLALAAVIVSSGRSAADDNLTIDLPSSRPPAQTAATPPVRQSPPVTSRRAASNSGIAMQRFGSRAAQTVGGAKEYTVGRLGLSSTASAIRAARGNNRSLLSRIQAGTYLTLTCEAGDWFGVLMANRTTGWIRKGDVKLLDYSVVSNHKMDAPAVSDAYVPDFSGDQLLSAGQQSIINAALLYRDLGVPYKWGGASSSGMDCSAFVQRCFSAVGLQLPRTAHEQYACGLPVDRSQLQAGDRVYFANASGEVVHTGIYLKDGMFIHASGKLKRVAVSNLNEDLYIRMYCGARR